MAYPQTNHGKIYPHASGIQKKEKRALSIKHVFAALALGVAALAGTTMPAAASSGNDVTIQSATYVGSYPTEAACDSAGQYYADGGTGYKCVQSFTREWWNLWIYG